MQNSGFPTYNNIFHVSFSDFDDEKGGTRPKQNMRPMQKWRRLFHKPYALLRTFFYKTRQVFFSFNNLYYYFMFYSC